MKIFKFFLFIYFVSINCTLAENIYLTCESPTKFKSSFVINEEKKKSNFSLDKSIEDMFNQKADKGIKVISEGIANNTNFTYEA